MRRLLRPSAGLPLLAAFAGASPALAGEAPTAALRVEGTSFRVSLPDGRELASPDLVGAILEAADEAGRQLTVRIDAVHRDPADPQGEVWLHSLSVRDAGTGLWRGLCGAAPDGTVAGFPLAGRWTPDGRHLRDPSAFTITCASGAAGKCVRLGYRPWAEVAGRSLWDHHQACVRMMRADYGGDGTPHTRDGTTIDVFDRLGIQRPEPPGPGTLGFEAAWGPDGAVCVRRTRIPDLVSIEALAARYPRLGGAGAPECSEVTPALLWNRS